jgi:hypothetical protein
MSSRCRYVEVTIESFTATAMRRDGGGKSKSILFWWPDRYGCKRIRFSRLLRRHAPIRSALFIISGLLLLALGTAVAIPALLDAPQLLASKMPML